MCAIFDSYNGSFKWIVYLTVVVGVHAFLHWFLAVPLLYFHFYECCNDKWTGNWVVWFLVASLGSWIGIFLLILFVWCCARSLTVKHLNESNVHLTDKKHPDVMINEKTMAAIEGKNFDEREEEIVALPDFDPGENLAVLQVNDVQPGNSGPVTSLEIPADETLVRVQSEIVRAEKTPREIFFKDLIEGAPDSYFDFDPEKISDLVKTKYEEPDVGGKNFFPASREKNENLTSEVMITLNESGLAVDEQFQTLKN